MNNNTAPRKKKKKCSVIVRTKEVGVDLNIPVHGWKRRALKLEGRGGV